MNCPNSEMHEKEHTEKLTEEIRQHMRQTGGAISFARYMELALYAPGLGYYMSGKKKLGADGDFLTAPEISPLFAKTVARQCEQIARKLVNYDILEFGAGSGQFAKDLLLSLQEKDALPERYFILEVSSDLCERQKQLLQDQCPEFFSRIHWLNSLEKFSIEGVIIANEVMDALPVHAFDIQNGAIKERFVIWQNNHFEWEPGEPITPGLKAWCESLRDNYFLPNGYKSEVHMFLSAWIGTVAKVLTKGIILLIDYGYGRKEYYRPDRNMGTLMCYRHHQKFDDPFKWVGLQDITAHVDFTTVIESADRAGCVLAGYTTQAGFLTACGILDIITTDDRSPKDKFQQDQAIKKLLFPNEMGELIKVMALSKQWEDKLIGFTLVDRKRDL